MICASALPAAYRPPRLCRSYQHWWGPLSQPTSNFSLGLIDPAHPYASPARENSSSAAIVACATAPIRRRARNALCCERHCLIRGDAVDQAGHGAGQAIGRDGRGGDAARRAVEVEIGHHDRTGAVGVGRVDLLLRGPAATLSPSMSYLPATRRLFASTRAHAKSRSFVFDRYRGLPQPSASRAASEQPKLLP
jgi:hypothetical protein